MDVAAWPLAPGDTFLLNSHRIQDFIPRSCLSLLVVFIFGKYEDFMLHL